MNCGIYKILTTIFGLGEDRGISVDDLRDRGKRLDWVANGGDWTSLTRLQRKVDPVLDCQSGF